MSQIRLQNLSFKYDIGTPLVLNNISLTINGGEIVLVIGPTGSGKSTLLQVMAGVAPQVTGGEISGSATLNNGDILRNPEEICRGRIGLVLQDPEPQLVNLTVEDEVAFGPENLKLSRKEILARVKWSIRQCRLEEHRNSFVYALSGGQKQRIAIAAGLAMRPEFFLLDAPLTNLDPVGAKEVLSTIAHLIKSRITSSVLITSNKIDTLLPLATRIVVMDSGKLIADGTPDEVLYKNGALLAQLGLFQPEVSLLWPVIRKFQSNTRLPRTPNETALTLKKAKPYVASLVDIRSTSNNSEKVVESSNVHFSYGQNTVLKGISFSVRKREFLAVVGQNGSGKSTLMNIICGLRKPSQGSLKVIGIDTKSQLTQGLVGYVFQYPEHQFISPTIGQELRFGLEERLPQEEIEIRVQEVLSLIGMSGDENLSPYSLSVGEKRMLSVATMLMLRPKILILDEPTTGLDRKLTNNLMQILRTYVRDYGMTVIQVSHDMEQVAEYCDRVIAIDDGKVIFNGSPTNLFLNDKILKTAKLEAPPVCQIGRILFPDSTNIPLTVSRFLKEVKYARS